MRQVIFITTLLLLFGCQFTNNDATDAKKAGLIPGTENPVIKKCSNGTAYIYKDYEIHVEPAPDAQGMNIFLYTPEVSGGNPCNLDRKTASNIISTGETEGNNFFAGLYKGNLFVDQGTGPNARMLSIYDLKTKSLILFSEYSDAELKEGVLTYYKTQVPDPGVIAKIPCPQAQNWRDQGLNVLYEQKESFNLKTQSKTPISEFRCKAGQ